MRELEVTDQLKDQLNAAYDEYQSQLPGPPKTKTDMVIGFNNYLRQRYGMEIRLDVQVSAYGLKQVLVTNEARYLWFILEHA